MKRGRTLIAMAVSEQGQGLSEGFEIGSGVFICSSLRGACRSTAEAVGKKAEGNESRLTSLPGRRTERTPERRGKTATPTKFTHPEFRGLGLTTS